ncbi:JAB domain-containing protein [Flagellimonas sp.]|uniref:JAB domain-containing protein n=1 Tax=Flagellimonas sp. TaxID=2058762 RepID=UPI003B52E8F9
MNVHLTNEQKIKVLNSVDVYHVMQQILLRENKIRRNQEHFWVVGLNGKNKIQFIELVALGAVNRVNVDPPDVFRMAIYKLASKVIFVHNRPSGSLEISEGDQNVTDRLYKVGKLINVEVADHLIITEDDYASFADEGIMDGIKNSGLFEIIGPERKELEQWKIDTEKKRAENQKAKDIATKMMAKGYDVDTIKELTGLSDDEVGRL